MKNICKSIEKYNPGKKRKVLIMFGDMIADVASNKKLHPVVIELFIRGEILNVCLLHSHTSLYQKV